RRGRGFPALRRLSALARNDAAAVVVRIARGAVRAAQPVDTGRSIRAVDARVAGQPIVRMLAVHVRATDATGATDSALAPRAADAPAARAAHAIRDAAGAPGDG